MALHRISSAVVLALGFCATALAEEAAGGKGQIELPNAEWHDKRIGQFVEIGNITILYQFSTLLNEPIEKYAMKWTAAKDRGAFLLGGLNQISVKSIGNIRFRSEIVSKNGFSTGAYIEFSPDIIPAPGADFPRLAVGASPNWDRMFIRNGDDYFDAERTKSIFREGFSLGKTTVIGLTAEYIDHNAERKKIAMLEEKKKELEEKKKHLEALKEEVDAMEESNEELKEERVAAVHKQALEEERRKKEAEEKRKKAEAEKLARAKAAEEKIAASVNKPIPAESEVEFPKSLPDKYGVRDLLSLYVDVQDKLPREDAVYPPRHPESSVEDSPGGLVLYSGNVSKEQIRETARKEQRRFYEQSWRSYRSGRLRFLPKFEEWLRKKGKWNAEVARWLANEYPDL